MRNHRPLFLLPIILLLLAPDGTAGPAAKANLPVVPARTVIKGSNHAALKAYFDELSVSPDPLDSLIELKLLPLIPAEYRKGCQSMVAAWGKNARGTSRSMLRSLHLQKVAGGRTLVLLAYTCYSNLLEFGNRSYDERLALLSIDSASSVLSFMPDATPCSKCSDLTRIGFGDTLHIGGSPAVSLNFTIFKNNPCCPRTDSVIIQRTRYYQFEGKDIREILMLENSYREVHPNPVALDTIITTTADNYFEKDPYGNLTKITATITKSINDRNGPQTIIVYAWNQKMRRFTQTRI